MLAAPFTRAVVALFIVLFAGSFADAAIILVPTDLAPESQYRLAFVTSGTTNATSSNIAYYNDFVTTQAALQSALSSLSTTWKAVGSTASISARDNTGTSPGLTGVPIYRLDGVRIAANNADLWDGTLLSPLNMTQDSNYLEPPTPIRVYTGSNYSGQGASNSARSLGAS